MANTMYGLAKEGFLGGDLDWDANTFKVDLVDGADYTPNYSTHQFRSQYSGGSGVVATSSALGSKTKTLGVADAADITWSTVTGDPSELIIGWKDAGGADTANALIWGMDTATGLPVTPNGGNISVAWNASGIFGI